MATYELNHSLTLENKSFLGSVVIDYQSYGTLNEDRSNAILVCHALSGDACAGDGGWWDGLIGPGKALDTTRYFVICSNVLGSCKGSTGPSSINPVTGSVYGASFPMVTIKDMVYCQKKWVDSLGISKLYAVIGGSMGGMQALQWSIDYPDYVGACIPIASTTKLSPQALAFGAVGRSAIQSDHHWNGGSYTPDNRPLQGLSIARMIGHITYLSEGSLEAKFGRDLQDKVSFDYHFSPEFKVESYLDYQGQKFVKQFDANSYLYLSRAMSYFDLAASYGSLEAAFKEVSCPFLIVSISSDWLYPSQQSIDLATVLLRLKKRVTYSEITSNYGHDAFLIEKDQLFGLIAPFLEQLC